MSDSPVSRTVTTKSGKKVLIIGAPTDKKAVDRLARQIKMKDGRL